MSDVAIICNANGTFDLDLGDGGASIDEGLRTAVIVSLFSDRLAEADDEIPDGSADRRGWWADAHADIENDLIGSRLWLLSREKQLAVTLGRARTYTRQALQWLVDDGLALSVEVAAENTSSGVLALQVRIVKADGQLVQYAVAINPAASQPGGAITDESGGVITDEAGNALFEEV